LDGVFFDDVDKVLRATTQTGPTIPLGEYSVKLLVPHVDEGDGWLKKIEFIEVA
jgi:hypothetical protein